MFLFIITISIDYIVNDYVRSIMQREKLYSRTFPHRNLASEIFS